MAQHVQDYPSWAAKHRELEEGQNSLRDEFNKQVQEQLRVWWKIFGIFASLLMVSIPIVLIWEVGHFGMLFCLYYIVVATAQIRHYSVR